LQVKNLKLRVLTVERQFARNGGAVRIEKGYWIKFFSKYSKSCNIWHLQDYRIAGCHNLPRITTLRVMCVLVYLET